MENNISNYIKNLKEGDCIKNYKELCALLHQPVLFGNSKVTQIKEFNRYFSFERECQKYIITKIYNIPRRRQDKRLGKLPSNFMPTQSFLIDLDKRNAIGVYIIKKDNNVYIGSTMVGFLIRFRQHQRNTKTSPHKLLQDGATFDALWIGQPTDTEEMVRQKEEYYIKYFMNLEQYNVVNTRMTTHVHHRDKDKKTDTPKQAVKTPEYVMFKINKDSALDVFHYCKDNNIDFIRMRVNDKRKY